jgi:hypothetical protein
MSGSTEIHFNTEKVVFKTSWWFSIARYLRNLFTVILENKKRASRICLLPLKFVYIDWKFCKKN